MSDFPAAYDAVTVLLKVPVQDGGVLGSLFRSDALHWLITKKFGSTGAVEIPTRALGIEAVQKAGSGRAALGGIAVSVGKQNPTGRQSIQVRRAALGVPAHHANPIV